MGLFSSSSSSSSWSQKVEQTKPVSGAATDKGLNVSASESLVALTQNVLDEGAIENAFNFSRDTFEKVNDSFQDVLDASSEQVANLQSSADKLTQRFLESTTGLIDKSNEQTEQLTSKVYNVYSDATSKIQDAYKTATGKINMEHILIGVGLLSGLLIFKSFKKV